MNFQHPESLNDWQRYAQARSILSHTNRATNSAWYKPAVELEWQLHIRVDGTAVQTWLYQLSKDTWQPSLELEEGMLAEPELVAATADKVFQLAKEKKASAFGLVLHLADEFATSEIKPDLNQPEELLSLREAAVEEPHSILEDTSTPADQNSWRVFPYASAGSSSVGTAISISRRYGLFFEELRKISESHQFPLIANALSAPLVATMGLGSLLKPSPGKPFVAILRYPRFTVMEFFDAQGDLRLIRTQQHRLPQRISILSHAIVTTNASLELIDPDVFIVSMVTALDPRIQMELSRSMPSSEVKEIHFAVSHGLESWCAEPILAVAGDKVAESAFSDSVKHLSSEGWARQDFLPIPLEQATIYPSRAEIQLARVLRLVRRVMYVVALAIVGWMGFGIFQIVMKESWRFDAKSTDKVKTKLKTMTAQTQEMEQWGTLLEDRSKGWANMELLARLFPERSGLMVKNFSHTVRVDKAMAKGAGSALLKEWKITGLARDEAVELLNLMNSQEGMSKFFSLVHKVTGNPSFDPSLPTRSMTVYIRTQENSGFKAPSQGSGDEADEGTYTMTFDMTITQRFEPEDPMAIRYSTPSKGKK